MSHDAATSQRDEKPGLFATLDIAIAQSGIRGIDADRLYALTAWSLRQGRRFPWYYKNERLILDAEGGRDEVIVTVAGAALAHMQGPAVHEAKDPLAEACYEAGKAWRNELRRQWGDLGTGQAEYWQNAALFTDLAPAGNTFGGVDNAGSEPRPVEDWITEHAVELAGPMAPEFDAENISDPRLARLWSKLTDKERELALVLADGASLSQLGEHLGISAYGAASRLHRIRKKAQGAAA